MQTWSTKIPVDQKHTVSLLRKGEGVIGTGKAFAFVRDGAGEEENFSFSFRSEESEGGAQIPESLRGGTLRSLRDKPITGAFDRRVRCTGSLFLRDFRHSRENR